MEHTKTFYPRERGEWRQWLAEHYKDEKEVWFVFPTVDSGEAGVSYNDAVEEALCFGWIDSTAGRLDETHQLRRFCPRKKGSPYSRPNIERMILMQREGKLLPEVYESVKELLETPYVYPADILARIAENADAQRHFETFSEPYKRIRVAYVDAARHRPEEFEKRLENFVRKTAAGRIITGYGGIEKYYK